MSDIHEKIAAAWKAIKATAKDWYWYTFVIWRDEFHPKVKTLADRKRAHKCEERWGL